MHYNILDKINTPEDLKKLNKKELPLLCSDLRNFLIDSVSENPGHFGAGLGVVELSVALHYVFNSPYDKIIWDVGHQAYVHKILTGRKNIFHTNRKKNGLSGFPKPTESKHDAFATGHASTSISAALGMAVASKLKNEKRNIVAVIGDGALTGGMAFEALNNAGKLNLDILVILNDNNMSIDPSVGALNDYLLNTTASKTFNKLKDDVWRYLRKTDAYKTGTIKSFSESINTVIKDLVINHSIFFEALNFQYFGRIDGHDVRKLTETLQNISKISGPKLLHIKTVKGKGFSIAEKNQTIFHAPGKFNKKTGEIVKAENTYMRFQDVFGRTMLELAEKNTGIVGVTPAMPTGSSLNMMMEKYPDRAFDVGIAEQHAVTFSAGMATQSLKPFCVIYSTFLQRAYDQIIHDVCLQKLPVVFCIDRAGLVGEDGETHQGIFDLAYLQILPDMVVAAPIDEHELRNMMFTAAEYNEGPFSIRYPRAYGIHKNPFNKPEIQQIGKAELLQKGKEIAILSIGVAGIDAKKAISKFSGKYFPVSHYNLRYLKPIDESALHEAFKEHKYIITIEDGVVKGGLGSVVAQFKSKYNYQAKLISLGVPDKFIPHATREEQKQMAGIDADNIFKVMKNIANL